MHIEQRPKSPAMPRPQATLSGWRSASRAPATCQCVLNNIHTLMRYMIKWKCKLNTTRKIKRTSRKPKPNEHAHKQSSMMTSRTTMTADARWRTYCKFVRLRNCQNGRVGVFRREIIRVLGDCRRLHIVTRLCSARCVRFYTLLSTVHDVATPVFALTLHGIKVGPHAPLIGCDRVLITSLSNLWVTRIISLFD